MTPKIKLFYREADSSSPRKPAFPPKIRTSQEEFGPAILAASNQQLTPDIYAMPCTWKIPTKAKIKLSNTEKQSMKYIGNFVNLNTANR
jgi:hypothetical protein